MEPGKKGERGGSWTPEVACSVSRGAAGPSLMRSEAGPRTTRTSLVTLHGEVWLPWQRGAWLEAEPWEAVSGSANSGSVATRCSPGH